MKTYLAVAAVLLTVPVLSLAAEEAAPDSAAADECFLNQETLTNNWFTLGDKLEESGVTLGASVTQLFQMNAWGDGTQTNKKDQRYTMSYDVEAEIDLEKILGLPGGSIYIAGAGSWHDGIDGDSIGSVFGVNDHAGGDRSFDLTELYYAQTLLDEKIFIKAGKLDVGGGYDCRGCSGSFDGNMYAEDETSQFLNGGLTGNPTIASPDEGMGVVMQINPVEWMYVAGGFADADADVRETGIRTAFHGDDNFFAIAEVGVAPILGDLQGTYRVGAWHSNADMEKLSGPADNEHYGFYLSFDQAILSENEEDDQGAGIFLRYGLTDEEVFEMDEFWSMGLQYKGLIPGRDNDLIGFGFASAEGSDNNNITETAEYVYEAYYNIHITEFFQIAPDFQYIHNAGWADADAFVIGLRAQITF